MTLRDFGNGDKNVCTKMKRRKRKFNEDEGTTGENKRSHTSQLHDNK